MEQAEDKTLVPQAESEDGVCGDDCRGEAMGNLPRPKKFQSAIGRVVQPRGKADRIAMVCNYCRIRLLLRYLNIRSPT